MNSVSSGGDKRKRIPLTLQQKIEICQRLEKGVKRSEITKVYNISQSTLCGIISNRHKYLEFIAESSSNRNIQVRKKLSKPKLEQLDSLLYEWYKKESGKGVRVTGNMLVERAKDLYECLELKVKMVFSTGWLYKFKLRHGIWKNGNSDKFGQHTIGSGVSEEYHKILCSIASKNEVTSEEIYYAGEAELYWRCLPPTTSSKSVTNDFIKREDRITVLACSNAAGTHKLKLVVIGKYNCPRILKGAENPSLKYVKNEDSRMNSDIMKEWFHNNFVSEVKRQLKSKGKPENSKVILLLNKCRISPCDMKSGQIFTKFVPVEISNVINPTDHGFIQNLQYHYRKDLSKKLYSYSGTEEDFQYTLSIKDALHGISNAWDMVEKETLKKAWKNILPSNLIQEESSVAELSDDYNNDDIIHYITEEMEINNSVDPLATDSLEDEELQITPGTTLTLASNGDNTVEYVLSGSNSEHFDVSRDKESKEEKKSREKGGVITWEKADEALQMFLKFAGDCECYSGLEMMQLNVIRSDFIKKREGYCGKSAI